MSSRRDALKKLTAFSVAGAMGTPTLGSLLQPTEADAADASAALSRVGVQLYTVRSEMEKSVERTLERVAKIGYREVEFAGYYNRTPAQIAAMLKSNGLTAPSAHVGIPDMRTKWSETLDNASTMGHRFLVIPYLDERDRGSADDYRRVADEFNKAAEAAKAHRIQFAYHNHDFEFERLAGTKGFDILLAECDAATVKFEMDLYWITKAKHDPIAYWNAYPGRFPLVHVKDVTASGDMVPVGKGSINWRKLFAQSNKPGIQHYFVEHDNPTSPFDSIGASYAYLRGVPAGARATAKK